MKNKNLEDKIERVNIFCKPCDKNTEHIYLGNFGVRWKPIYLYSCQVCHGKYQSLNKLNKNQER